MLHMYVKISNGSFQAEEQAGIYIATGNENTAEIFKNGINPEDILHRETAFRIRDCTISKVAQLLWYDFTTDIDGIVGTLNLFSDITAPFSYLGILPRQRQSLLKVYDIIRKHVPLARYSRNGLQCLRWSVSTKCLEGGGFEFSSGLTSKNCDRKKFRYANAYVLEDAQYEFYENFRKTFSKCVQALPSNELCRGTFKKNEIIDIRKWRVFTR